MIPRPKVAATLAISADGKLTTARPAPSRFTSAEDKRRLRTIRASGDAVMAGASTVAADRMSMRISDPALRKLRKSRGLPPEPLRVIVSNSGRLDPGWKVFSSRGSPLVVFAGAAMPAKTRARVARSADLWIFPAPRVPLATTLAILRRFYRVKRLVCEGGPRLIRALALAQLLDEIHLTVAPRVFGGAQAPTLAACETAFLAPPVAFRIRSLEILGDECFLCLART